MDCVYARGLTKTYKSRVKAPGLMSAVKALAKPEYRQVQAVKGINITVKRGERVAFIGPNGAGKSTTIKMMTGILSPTSGELSVLGLSPMKDRKKLSMSIGTVFGQKSQLWFHLPPADSFALLGAIYDIDSNTLKKRTDKLREQFGLSDFFNTPVRRLSLGQRIRCEVAASLIHEPEMLFLDEPTIGLDVVVKRELRERILELNRENGATVFLTSHDAGDIENICERAVVIDGGEIVLDEGMESLRANHISHKKLTVRYSKDISMDTPAWAIKAETGPDVISLTIDTRKTPVEKALSEMVSKGPVRDITVEEPAMEQIIASIFTKGGD